MNPSIHSLIHPEAVSKYLLSKLLTISCNSFSNCSNVDKVFVPSELDPRIDKISNRVLERNGFQLVTYNNRKDLLEKVLLFTT